MTTVNRSEVRPGFWNCCIEKPEVAVAFVDEAGATVWHAACRACASSVTTSRRAEITEDSQDPENFDPNVYWLSFVDTKKPEGDKFLGVAIVRGRSAEGAVEMAWHLGINPGGEVLIAGPMPEGTYPVTDMCRLLSKAEAEALVQTVEEPTT